MSNIQWTKPKNTTGFYSAKGRRKDGVAVTVQVWKSSGWWQVATHKDGDAVLEVVHDDMTAPAARSWVEQNLLVSDIHGNHIAREGLDFCACGCKYWEFDKCIDCGDSILMVRGAVTE